MVMPAVSMVLLCRIEIVNGKLWTFTFKDKAVGLYIDAGIATGPGGAQAPAVGYQSIVQDLAWPSPQDEVPLTTPAQIDQHPSRPWFQEELLAHTLLHRQMVQPAMNAAQLQVTYVTLHMYTCQHCVCRFGWCL